MHRTDGGILLFIDIALISSGEEYTREGDHSILILSFSDSCSGERALILVKLPQFRKNHLPLEILYLRAYPHSGSLGCTADWWLGGRGFSCPATFFHGDWSWNFYYGHSLSSADFRFRRTIVSFWRQNAHRFWSEAYNSTFGANSSPL